MTRRVNSPLTVDDVWTHLGATFGDKYGVQQISHAFGIDPVTWDFGTETERKIRFHQMLIAKSKSGELQKRMSVDDVKTELAEVYLDKSTDDRHKGWKDFNNIYTDRWEYGLDQTMGRLMQDRSPTGIRQAKRQIYHLNIPNSTGSNSGDLYIKNLQETAGVLISTSIQAKTAWENAGVEGAPYNQGATNSFVKVYN